MKITGNSLSVHTGLASGLKQQRGALTLALSLTILILSTLVTFNVSRAILMEQKITNNDSRAKMAFEAAEAGMIEAFGYLGNNPDVDGNRDIDPVFDTNNDGQGDSDTVAVGPGSVTVTTCDLDTVDCAPGGPMTTIRVVAKGFSDDRSAIRTITQTMITIDPLVISPDMPVITRGIAGVGGSIYVENLEGHTTVWAAGGVTLTGNSGTAIPNINTGYPGCMDLPQTCAPAQASNANLRGPDIVENDLTLSGLSSDELFQVFFGMNTAKYRHLMVSIETETASFSAAAQGAQSEVIWYEGGGDWHNVSLGCSGSPGSQKQCARQNQRPCITIVNGNVRFSGNNNVTGIVFVMGNVELAGNSRISGSIISSGDFVADSGTMNVYYRSDVLAKVASAGVVSVGAGTWKDF